MSDISSKDFYEKLRELFRRNLDCVTATDRVQSGIYRKTGGDHFVIAACLSEAPLLMLAVCDKVLTHPVPDLQWSWQYRKNSISNAVTRLNKETAAGVHELHEFPDCVIYTFKQSILMTSELAEPVFCALVERGIREFETGIVALRGKR